MIDGNFRSEIETTKRDAASSECKSPEERTQIFESLMEAVDSFRAHLTLEERKRRRLIAQQLDPAPIPWWRNLRKEAFADNDAEPN